MGNFCSKVKRDKKPKKDEVENKKDDDSPEEEEEQFFSNETEDDEDYLYHKQTFKENLEMFVLNHVLMGVQFFKNFETEIEELRKDAYASEGDPIEAERLRIYKVDRLMDHVGKNVWHRPRHGPKKNTESLLHPIRSFITYDNVFVTDNAYKIVETTKEIRPYYTFLAEPPTEDDLLHSSGYVNLKELAKAEDIEEEIYASPQGEPSPNNSVIDYQELRLSQHALHVPHQTNNNIYDYQTVISKCNTKYVHQERPGNAPTSSCRLPMDSFSQIKKKKMDGRRTGSQALYEIRTYINSQKFFSNFLDVYTYRLAHIIKVSAHQMQLYRLVSNTIKASMHISPAFKAMQWPDELTLAFIFPNKHTQYEWPPKKLVRKIQRTNMFLLPCGFLNRRGENKYFPLQWRYINPLGEELLLLHTMHSHIRSYLFTLTLYKSFLAEEDSCLGIEHTHILHLLFKEIKKNFVAWPEDKPGESLLRFLKQLKRSLLNTKLEDFFIHDRNLLESCPSKFLNVFQGKLSAIIQNPLSHVLLALSNLRTNKLYPELKYSEIYKLATIDNLLFFLNPDLKPKEKKVNQVFEKKDANRRWNQMMLQNLQETQKKENEITGSTESIDVKCKVSVEEDTQRRQELLIKFIPHFIEMARKSIEYQAENQARLYLLQASRLTRLLEGEGDEGDNVKSYRVQIECEIKNCNDMKKMKSQPNTPLEERLSGQVRFSVHERELPKVPEP